MARRKRKNKQKRNHYIRAISLFLMVLALSYFIFSSNFLKPRINELTASYISFNNSYSTDMLKITNVQKMKDEKGKSTRNKSKLNVKITGTNLAEYQLVAYPINGEIDAKYIKFSINDGQNKTINTLEKTSLTKDGGRVLYTGTTNRKSDIIISMWISTDYKDKINNNSYEIKIIEKV